MQRRLQKLAEFDVANRSHPGMANWRAPVLFGVLCTVVIVVVRLGVDAVAPTAGPFAPIYSTVFIATLFGRLRAGLVAYVGCFAWVLLTDLPSAAARSIPLATDATRSLVSGTTVFVVMIFAEVFRQAVRRAVAGREKAIADLRDREPDLQLLNASSGNRASSCSAMTAMSRSSPPRPVAAMIPNSAIWARGHCSAGCAAGSGSCAPGVASWSLAGPVTSRRRTASWDGSLLRRSPRHRPRRSCHAFIGLHVLCGINLTSGLSATSSPAQSWAEAHASIPTRQGGIFSNSFSS